MLVGADLLRLEHEEAWSIIQCQALAGRHSSGTGLSVLELLGSI